MFIMFYLSVFIFVILLLFTLFAIMQVKKTKTRRRTRCRRKSLSHSFIDYSHPGWRFILRFLCCSLFCPPCPASVIAKLAFFPPKRPKYSFVEATFSGPSPIPKTLQPKYLLHIPKASLWPYDVILLRKYVEAMFTTTSTGNKIACVYFRPVPVAKFVIFFSHANACDLGQMSAHYFDLGRRVKCHVFSYDYSGYGLSTGRPSERNQLADAEAAYTTLTTTYAIPPEKIIFYGQSIGSVPTVYLASKCQTAGVVLHAAFLSASRLYCDRCWCRKFLTSYCCNPFPNVDRIAKIQTPVLLVHGKKDEIVPFSHAVELHQRLGTWAVEPKWLEKAEHDNVVNYKGYWKAMERFVESDLNGNLLVQPESDIIVDRMTPRQSPATNRTRLPSSEIPTERSMSEELKSPNDTSQVAVTSNTVEQAQRAVGYTNLFEMGKARRHFVNSSMLSSEMQ